MKVKAYYKLACILASLTLTAGMIVVISSRKGKSTIDWDKLTKDYSKNAADSLKLEAVYYLKKNIEGMTSELLGVKSPNSDSLYYLKEVDADKMYAQKLKTLFSSAENIQLNRIVKDEEFLTTQQIKDNIDSAFKAWNNSAWGDDVSKEIFFEYMLPYKIYEEYPSKWRPVLASSMSADFTKWRRNNTLPYHLNKKLYIDSFVNRFVIPQNKKWYNYSLARNGLGKNPSFNEIVLFKDGDCFSEAAINTYLLRAAGIPAGYDFVPSWGNGNGAHATAVYWSPDERKMRLLLGLDLGAPKVFRRTFKNTKMWEHQIEPIVGERPFELAFLKSDRILDVTDEHIKTSHIRVSIPKDISISFAYICVFNYEKWIPVFWAGVHNNQATFRSMGRGIVYRVKFPSENGDDSFGKPFLLTQSQTIIHPTVSRSMINLSLKSINNGKEAFVKAERKYLLNYLDQNGEWIPLRESICKVDSLINFPRVQSATFYKLSDLTINKHLSRIFSYNNGKQIWY